MSLISQTIANLFNGVSQQPPALRSPSQATEQINIDSSLVYGLRQRPPTVYVATAVEGTGLPTHAYFHLIDHGVNDRWIAVFADSNVRVFNADTGDEATVQKPNGDAYIATDNPREHIRCLTVADYTFVVNRSVQVTVTSSTLATEYGTVQSFGQLPGEAAQDGAYYKIIGDASNGFTSYWVVRQDGAWVETSDPNESDSFTAAELPWRLIKTDAAEFTLEPIDYAQRAVGDPVTNPLPSFTGKYIRDVFFFRNRLGFITSDTVVMSRAGDYFNFFPRTMTAVSDDDPIDVQIAHPKAVSLWHAIPFNTSLLLLGSTVQFVLSAGDVLSPRSVRVDASTEFDCSHVARPVGLGPNLYFVQPTSTSSRIREYYVEKDSVTNDALDVTAHCPAYLPSYIAGMATCSSEDLLVAWSGLDDSLYVYRVKWNGDKRVQSSWSRYEIGGAGIIFGAAFSGSRLYLLSRDTFGWYIDYIDFADSVVDATADDGSPITFRLDRRVSLTGSYDAGTDTTTWTLPYSTSSGMGVITSDTHPEGSGIVLSSVIRPTADTVTAPGDWSAGECVLGIPYTASYKLSPIYLRDQQGNARVGGRLQLRKLTIHCRNTGYFEVVVEPQGRLPSTRPWIAATPGGVPLGDLQIASRHVDVAVMSNAETVSITIQSSLPLPFAIQSIQWTGFYTTRTRMM